MRVSSLSKKVAILYGFGEGYWNSLLLRQALVQARFNIIDTVADAEIIIAHSGGMYAIPSDVTDKIIMIVGPCCGRPGWSWLRTQGKKVWQDMVYHQKHRLFGRWLQKSWWNGVYLIGQIPRLPQLWRIHHQHAASLPVIVGAKAVIVVTYPDDPWSGFLSPELYKKHPNYQFISLKAIHDDIWLHPECYIDLLLK